jgi:phosphatidate phosphatase APP1
MQLGYMCGLHKTNLRNQLKGFFKERIFSAEPLLYSDWRGNVFSTYRSFIKANKIAG